jgi:hypothetical protein
MPTVYKMYLGRYTSDWHALSAEERRELETLARAAFEAARGQSLIDCDSQWSNDGWHWFGVEQFPDLEAVQQYQAQLATLGWHRYVAELAVLGTKRGQLPAGAGAEAAGLVRADAGERTSQPDG